MRLAIPEIGTQYKLTADWTFDLFFEYRNQKFGEALKITPPSRQDAFGRVGGGWWDTGHSTPVTLPAGAILKVDRIYIRKGASHYGSGDLSKFSSLTFYVECPALLGKKKARFWAKLRDVNRIECELYVP